MGLVVIFCSLCQINFLCNVVAISDIVHDMETIFPLCLLLRESANLFDIGLMPWKLQFAVSSASLIFQRYIQMMFHLKRSCIVSTSYTGSHIVESVKTINNFTKTEKMTT